MLNNIKIEPLNPSSSHIVHKRHLLCHHKICAHKWQSMCTSTPKFPHILSHQILSYNTKETFIGPRHTVVGQRRVFSKIWLIDASLSMKGRFSYMLFLLIFLHVQELFMYSLNVHVHGLVVVVGK